jgi:hypothetical protein
MRNDFSSASSEPFVERRGSTVEGGGLGILIRTVEQDIPDASTA